MGETQGHGLHLLPASDEVVGQGVEELTKKELAVLALMAEGLSNPGIAERMTLGVRTIESHVATIFLKLGLWPDEGSCNRRVRAVLAYQRACPGSEWLAA